MAIIGKSSFGRFSATEEQRAHLLLAPATGRTAATVGRSNFGLAGTSETERSSSLVAPARNRVAARIELQARLTQRVESALLSFEQRIADANLGAQGPQAVRTENRRVELRAVGFDTAGLNTAVSSLTSRRAALQAEQVSKTAARAALTAPLTHLAALDAIFGTTVNSGTSQFQDVATPGNVDTLQGQINRAQTANQRTAAVTRFNQLRASAATEAQATAATLSVSGGQALFTQLLATIQDRLSNTSTDVQRIRTAAASASTDTSPGAFDLRAEGDDTGIDANERRSSARRRVADLDTLVAQASSLLTNEQASLTARLATVAAELAVVDSQRAELVQLQAAVQGQTTVTPPATVTTPLGAKPEIDPSAARRLAGSLVAEIATLGSATAVGASAIAARVQRFAQALERAVPIPSVLNLATAPIASHSVATTEVAISTTGLDTALAAATARIAAVTALRPGLVSARNALSTPLASLATLGNLLGTTVNSGSAQFEDVATAGNVNTLQGQINRAQVNAQRAAAATQFNTLRASAQTTAQGISASLVDSGDQALLNQTLARIQNLLSDSSTDDLRIRQARSGASDDGAPGFFDIRSQGQDTGVDNNERRSAARRAVADLARLKADATAIVTNEQTELTARIATIDAELANLNALVSQINQLKTSAPSPVMRTDDTVDHTFEIRTAVAGDPRSAIRQLVNELGLQLRQTIADATPIVGTVTPGTRRSNRFGLSS